MKYKLLVGCFTNLKPVQHFKHKLCVPNSHKSRLHGATISSHFFKDLKFKIFFEKLLFAELVSLDEGYYHLN